MYEIQGVDVAVKIGRILAEFGEVVYHMNCNEYWTREMVHKIMSKHFERLAEKLKAIDFTKCTQEELSALGFAQWSEESNLMLIPLWIYDILPDGIELGNIFGGKFIKGKDTIYTDDPRAGCISYGIVAAP